MNLSDRLQARALLLDEVYLAKSQAEHQVKVLTEENAALKAELADRPPKPDSEDANDHVKERK